MLIDNALHNQSNLTNSTKDVGNDKGWSLALPRFAKDVGFTDRPKSKLTLPPLRLTMGVVSILKASLVFVQSNLNFEVMLQCLTVGSARYSVYSNHLAFS
jgi:hypothetical protein